MSLLHTYVSSKLNDIRTSSTGYKIRNAIADALEYVDGLIANQGSSNTFVVCTQAEYDALDEDEKTATAYFIVSG